MQAKISIDDKEIKKLIERFTKYEREKLSQLSKRVVSAGYKVQGEAKTDILVDTGRARSSTLVKFAYSVGDIVGVTIGTYVDYAMQIERRKPFLYKAFAKERVLFIRDLKNILKRK